jgi:hypothetical protein
MLPLFAQKGDAAVGIGRRKRECGLFTREQASPGKGNLPGDCMLAVTQARTKSFNPK